MRPDFLSARMGESGRMNAVGLDGADRPLIFPERSGLRVHPVLSVRLALRGIQGLSEHRERLGHRALPGCLRRAALLRIARTRRQGARTSPRTRGIFYPIRSLLV